MTRKRRKVFFVVQRPEADTRSTADGASAQSKKDGQLETILAKADSMGLTPKLKALLDAILAKKDDAGSGE